jgi:hypothetical protein
MKRIISICVFSGLLAMLFAPAVAAQARRKPGARIGKGLPGRTSKQVRPPPQAVLDRFERMTPEQRRQALERVPPDRRKQFEERLDRYSQLSPEERERLNDRYDTFRNLSPERQEAVRRNFRRFNTLPEERQGVVRRELEELSKLPDEDRRARINSDEFRNKYNRGEQQLLKDLSRVMAEPEPEPAEPRP